MKTIPVNVSPSDYEWLTVKALQRQMIVAQIIQEMVKDASQQENQSRNSVAHLQAFVKQPPVFTSEEADVLERIILMAREGKVIPPDMLCAHESTFGNHND